MSANTNSPQTWREALLRSLLLFIHQEKLGNANNFGDFTSKTQRCSCAQYSSMDQEKNFSSSHVHCTQSLGQWDKITAQSSRDIRSNHGEGHCTHTVLPVNQEALVADCPCVAPCVSGSATPEGPCSCVSPLQTHQLRLPLSMMVMPGESWPKSLMTKSSTSFPLL